MVSWNSWVFNSCMYAYFRPCLRTVQALYCSNPLVFSLQVPLIIYFVYSLQVRMGELVLVYKVVSLLFNCVLWVLYLGSISCEPWEYKSPPANPNKFRIKYFCLDHIRGDNQWAHLCVFSLPLWCSFPYRWDWLYQIYPQWFISSAWVDTVCEGYHFTLLLPFQVVDCLHIPPSFNLFD